MNEDTKNLLKECTAGCQMALGSLDQIKHDITDHKLMELVSAYREKHESFERDAARMLREDGEEEKSPKTMASMMSRCTTRMKLMAEKDSHQIAKLMMDGCNMGIQSVSEYQNQYRNASKEALELAQKLVRAEEDFMEEMKQFL